MACVSVCCGFHGRGCNMLHCVLVVVFAVFVFVPLLMIVVVVADCGFADGSASSRWWRDEVFWWVVGRLHVVILMGVWVQDDIRWCGRMEAV